MLDIKELLFEICESDKVYDSDYDLVENGILDSLAFIELFERLEDEGVEIAPTRIDRERLRTSGKIEELVREYAVIDN